MNIAGKSMYRFKTSRRETDTSGQSEHSDAGDFEFFKFFGQTCLFAAIVFVSKRVYPYTYRITHVLCINLC